MPDFTYIIKKHDILIKTCMLNDQVSHVSNARTIVLVNQIIDGLPVLFEIHPTSLSHLFCVKKN